MGETSVRAVSWRGIPQSPSSNNFEVEEGDAAILRVLNPLQEERPSLSSAREQSAVGGGSSRRMRVATAALSPIPKV